MEILKIQSAHGLTTSILDQRPEGTFTYDLNVRQFQTAQRDWQRNHLAQERPLGVMTLDFQRIWITREEIEKIAAAIQSTRSPLTLG